MKKMFCKIRHKVNKILCQPIRVFCFHQVSAEFDASTMWEADWTEIEQFQRNIVKLKRKYNFISLQEAYRKLNFNGCFRFKRFAVLTSDDGWYSLKEIIPWLMKEQIPLTLFLNPCYLDGKNKPYRDTEKLLEKKDVEQLLRHYGDSISIASHGWSHRCSTDMTIDEFCESVDQAESFLEKLNGKIPFFAFAFGRYTENEIQYLKSRDLVPVLIDGQANIKNDGVIHRECLDKK